MSPITNAHVYKQMHKLLFMRMLPSSGFIKVFGTCSSALLKRKEMQERNSRWNGGTIQFHSDLILLNCNICS